MRPENQTNHPIPTRPERLVLAQWQLVGPSAWILRLDEHSNEVIRWFRRSTMMSTWAEEYATIADKSLNHHLLRHPQTTSRVQSHGPRLKLELPNLSSVAKVDAYAVQTTPTGAGATFAPESGGECCGDESRRATQEDDRTVAMVTNNNSNTAPSSWHRYKHRSSFSVVVRSASSQKTEATPSDGPTNKCRALRDVKDGIGVRTSFGMNYPDPMCGASTRFVQRMDAIHALQTNTIRHERSHYRKKTTTGRLL